MDTNKSTFLYSSITDIQNTIKAIDTKINAILVLLFIPMTKLNSIYLKCHFLISYNDYWVKRGGYCIVALFILAWLLAYYSAFKTIMAIKNPADRIPGKKPSGIFYNGHLFKLTSWDAFFNLSRKSAMSFSQFKQKVEETTCLEDELLLEQMKLSFIRDVKIKRVTVAFCCTKYWVIFGGIIWLSNLIIG